MEEHPQSDPDIDNGPPSDAENVPAKRPKTKEGWCNTCKPATFQEALQTHKKNIHAVTAEVTYPDKTVVELTRNVTTGLFHCLRCDQNHINGQGIRRHARKCKRIGDPGLPLDPDQLHNGAPLTYAPAALRRQEDQYVPRAMSAPIEEDPVPLADSEPPSTTMPLILSNYLRAPDADTVVSHPTFNLSILDIVVNTPHCVIICLSCEVAVELSAVESHIHSHLPRIHVPKDLVIKLTAEYQLCRFDQLKFPTARAAPVFGLALTSRQFYFCDRCDHGYGTRESLRSHQNGQCQRGPGDPGNTYRLGYGQSFTTGARNSVFQVEPSLLPPTPADEVDLVSLFTSTRPPPINYSNVPFTTPVREEDLNNFLYREGWIQHIEGFTSEELEDACRASSEEDGTHYELKALVSGYIDRVQPEISKLTAFGLRKTLAKVGDAVSMATFDHLTEKSCGTYGHFLWRLFSSLFRQLEKDASRYRYPLTEQQEERLWDLLGGLDAEETTEDELITLIHAAVLPLFSHLKTDNRLDKYFSTVSCFAVLTSFVNGTVRKASTITSQLMQLIYCNRAAQLTEIRAMLDADPTLTFLQAYETRKIYLKDEQETPMAFLFNTYCLLKVIRSDEHTEEASRWIDDNKMFLQFGNEIVSVAGFKDAYVIMRDKYLKVLQEDIFFGMEPPPEISVLLDPSTLMDDLTNRSPGHSFLDNLQNPCYRVQDAYVKWILSVPELAERFTYVREGKLIWRPIPCLQHLETIDKANEYLTVAGVIGSADCARATNMGSYSLRNSPLSPIRSLQMLYRTVCFVGIQDKTSHKRLQDRYVPAAPPRLLAPYLVQNLAVIRPLQVLWVTHFLGPEEGRRFHLALHPRLSGNLTSDALSKQLAAATEKPVGAALGILKWRKVVETVTRVHGDPKAYEIAKTYFFDIKAHHSGSTGNAFYQQAAGSIPGISPEHIVGCIKHSISWQQLTGIDDGVALSVTSVGNDRVSDDAALTLINAGADVPATTLDLANMAANIAKMISPEIVRTLKQEMNASFIESQALYRAKPPPAPDPLRLPAPSDVQPHPSRRLDFANHLGKNFTFSCYEQAVVLEKILARKTHVLGILTCGTGKTWLALMAAKIYGGKRSSVFILPHSGLHLDLVRRTGQMGIRTSKWDPRGAFDTNATVIWAVVEHLDFDAFKAFMTFMARSDLLDRIVFDEIHRLLTDLHYRDVFQFCSTLSKYGAPIFGASATIPVHLIPLFRQLSGVDSWDIVRMRVGRPNLAIAVHTADTDAELIKDLHAFVLKRLATYGEEDRMMVFAQTVAEAKELARILGTEAFYAGQDEEKKAELFNDWIAKKEVIVSTSLLASGTDYAHVRDVVFFHLMFTAFDQQQGGDRAGRDGELAFVTTFVRKGEKVRHNPDDVPLGQKELGDWAHNKRHCRQIMLAQYLRHP
ncbi:hypothetical protein C8F04DRAFT_1343061 [Mycena alexandri]|uniref:DNA 3'-5' helicase n=1 Tax=Mycena alexandri TaxID=1745969 RepID=A0AAD6WL82_9AGAR|nr:hypothetical protein C8F04DRAFT_1343061 [Mycena alexandri]